MTYVSAKSLRQPAAIDTLRLWDDLTIQQCVDAEDQRDSRWQQRQSPNRRAKSHSPSRRSPKLKHTNGRLDEDPLEVAPDKEKSREEDKQQLLARLKPTPVIPTRPEQDEMQAKSLGASQIPKRAGIRRSVTCTSHGKIQQECSSGGSPSSSPTRRFKICYRDEALRERSAANTRRILVNARQMLCASSGDVTSQTLTMMAPGCGSGEPSSSPSSSISSNQQKLALKALKYRNLLARASEIDDDRLKDPTFDVTECLDVKWCKV